MKCPHCGKESVKQEPTLSFKNGELCELLEYDDAIAIYASCLGLNETSARSQEKRKLIGTFRRIAADRGRYAYLEGTNFEWPTVALKREHSATKEKA